MCVCARMSKKELESESWYTGVMLSNCHVVFCLFLFSPPFFLRANSVSVSVLFCCLFCKGRGPCPSPLSVFCFHVLFFCLFCSQRPRPCLVLRPCPCPVSVFLALLDFSLRGRVAVLCPCSCPRPCLCLCLPYEKWFLRCAFFRCPCLCPVSVFVSVSMFVSAFAC